MKGASTGSGLNVKVADLLRRKAGKDAVPINVDPENVISKPQVEPPLDKIPYLLTLGLIPASRFEVVQPTHTKLKAFTDTECPAADVPVRPSHWYEQFCGDHFDIDDYSDEENYTYPKLQAKKKRKLTRKAPRKKKLTMKAHKAPLKRPQEAVNLTKVTAPRPRQTSQEFQEINLPIFPNIPKRVENFRSGFPKISPGGMLYAMPKSWPHVAGMGPSTSGSVQSDMGPSNMGSNGMRPSGMGITDIGASGMGASGMESTGMGSSSLGTNSMQPNGNGPNYVRNVGPNDVAAGGVGSYHPDSSHPGFNNTEQRGDFASPYSWSASGLHESFNNFKKTVELPKVNVEKPKSRLYMKPPPIVTSQPLQLPACELYSMPSNTATNTTLDKRTRAERARKVSFSEDILDSKIIKPSKRGDKKVSAHTIIRHNGMMIGYLKNAYEPANIQPTTLLPRKPGRPRLDKGNKKEELYVDIMYAHVASDGIPLTAQSPATLNIPTKVQQIYNAKFAQNANTNVRPNYGHLLLQDVKSEPSVANTEPSILSRPFYIPEAHIGTTMKGKKEPRAIKSASQSVKKIAKVKSPKKIVKAKQTVTNGGNVKRGNDAATTAGISTVKPVPIRLLMKELTAGQSATPQASLLRQIKHESRTSNPADAYAYQVQSCSGAPYLLQQPLSSLTSNSLTFGQQSQTISSHMSYAEIPTTNRHLENTLTITPDESDDVECVGEFLRRTPHVEEMRSFSVPPQLYTRLKVPGNYESFGAGARTAAYAGNAEAGQREATAWNGYGTPRQWSGESAWAAESPAPTPQWNGGSQRGQQPISTPVHGYYKQAESQMAQFSNTLKWNTNTFNKAGIRPSTLLHNEARDYQHRYNQSQADYNNRFQKNHAIFQALSSECALLMDQRTGPVKTEPWCNFQENTPHASDTASWSFQGNMPHASETSSWRNCQGNMLKDRDVYTTDGHPGYAILSCELDRSVVDVSSYKDTSNDARSLANEHEGNNMFRKWET